MLKLHHLTNHCHHEYFISEHHDNHDNQHGNSTVDTSSGEMKVEIHELLQKFYNELLVPNFPLKEELEEFEEFIYLLSDESLSDGFCGFHHFLFLEDLNKQEEKSRGYGTIAAAATLEYYPMSNCGLLGYLVVDERYRGQKLTNMLMEHSKRILKEESSKRSLENLLKRVNDQDRDILNVQMKYLHVSEEGHVNNVDEYISKSLANLTLSFIVECEHSDSPNEIMDPKLRQIIYSKLGFNRMKFDYVQRLSLSDKPLELLLLHQYISNEHNDQNFVNSHSIATFIYEFYKITYYRYDFHLIDNCYDHTMTSMYNCSVKGSGNELQLENDSNVNDWSRKFSTFSWKEFIGSQQLH